MFNFVQLLNVSNCVTVLYAHGKSQVAVKLLIGECKLVPL